ncbi:MAG: D-alanine--D-alanine ligase [Candidatus Gastranaerophilales bacterium]|nr:D-alanine--D-alanine ligase [Candidatus Gastranaerophilales bacterium]
MEQNNKIDKSAKIAVLCGGMSKERDVSLRSGKNVLNALFELGYKNSILIDVDRNVSEKLKDVQICYNALHGRYGEDGCIQGLLEILGIKYTGCNVKSSAICMDKETAKNILKNEGLPVIKSVCVHKGDDFYKAVLPLKFPLMVKPVKEGSSIGMSKVNTENELENAMTAAYKSDNKVLIEEFINGKSLTVGVLEDEDKTFATPILGFETKTEWYNYEAKYTKGVTKFILPFNIDLKLTEKIQKMAIKAHKACECSGVSRVDFLLADNKPYILEINTSPGMTDLSDLPAQANYMGIDYKNLVQLILNTALFEK